MVADYQSRLASADMALWQQVEKSVLLAPYWLDGHCLSAQTALRLGYKQVADTIRDEVIRFLERLPQLTGLLFNDRTPFLSEQTKQWLAASPDGKVAPVAQIGEESQAARACFAGRVWRRRCDIWTCYPKAIPAISFTASTLPHS